MGGEAKKMIFSVCLTGSGVHGSAYPPTPAFVSVSYLIGQNWIGVKKIKGWCVCVCVCTVNFADNSIPTGHCCCSN